MYKYLPMLISSILILRDFKRGLPKENRKEYVKEKMLLYLILTVIGVMSGVVIKYVVASVQGVPIDIFIL